MGAFKKYVRSKFANFDPPLPLVRPYSFYKYPPKHTFALVSYPPPPPSLSKKKFHGIHKFSNKKSGSEEREKN